MTNGFCFTFHKSFSTFQKSRWRWPFGSFLLSVLCLSALVSFNIWNIFFHRCYSVKKKLLTFTFENNPLLTCAKLVHLLSRWRRWVMKKRNTLIIVHFIVYFTRGNQCFAVLHWDINSLLHLAGHSDCKKSRSAKVKDGIIKLILRNYLIDRYMWFWSVLRLSLIWMVIWIDKNHYTICDLFYICVCKIKVCYSRIRSY
jgi:hypothetical protein